MHRSLSVCNLYSLFVPCSVKREFNAFAKSIDLLVTTISPFSTMISEGSVLSVVCGKELIRDPIFFFSLSTRREKAIESVINSIFFPTLFSNLPKSKCKLRLILFSSVKVSNMDHIKICHFVFIRWQDFRMVHIDKELMGLYNP